jgi:Transposase IS66 family
LDEVIEAARQIELATGRQTAPIPYYAVDSTGGQRRSTAAVYIFRLAGPTRLANGTAVEVRGVPDLMGWVKDQDGDALTVRFTGGVPRIGGPRDKQPPARNLLEDLYHRHDDVLRFCYDTTIPPTNNLAERDLGPNKTPAENLRPADQRHRDHQPADHPQLPIHRRQHGINAMTALRDAITGNPWTPPAARIVQP